MFLLLSGGFVKTSVEPRFDPGRRVEQSLVVEALTDQLDAEWQPATAVADGQGQAGCPGQGPDGIESRVAGRAEPFRSFADGARGEQHVEFPEHLVEVAAKRL